MNWANDDFECYVTVTENQVTISGKMKQLVKNNEIEAIGESIKVI